MGNYFFFLCSVKVLILHQHFNTPYKGGAIRSYYLAKALVDRGIQTIVITAHNEKDNKTENVDGIKVHYLPIPYDNRFGFYRRGFAFIRFAWGAIRLSGKFSDISLCYAISVPLTVGIAALFIRLRYKIPYIFEVGDLWPDAPIQMGFVKNKIFQKSLFRLEKSIYKNAAAIVALSPSIQNAVQQKISGKKTHLIPNMADTDFFGPEPKNTALEEKFNVTGKFVVSYVGAIGVANGLDHFLECARCSERAGLPIHFLLCGDGALLEGITKSVKIIGLRNFTILPFQNRDGVKEIMNVTDAVFISYKSVPVLETGSPNKYFDGLASGKLIVINFGGWIKDEIKLEECGIFINPGDPSDFINKIEPFLLKKTLLNEYQKKARQLAERKYSRAILSKNFVDNISEGNLR